TPGPLRLPLPQRQATARIAMTNTNTNAPALTSPDFLARIDPARFVDVDLVDENFRQNALPDLLADWATRPPFYALRNRLPVMVCTRLRDVKEIYNHPDRFTVEIPPWPGYRVFDIFRSEEHTSELQSRENLVCRLLLEKKKKTQISS